VADGQLRCRGARRLRDGPGSITDLAAEFGLTYTGQNAARNGTGTIALVGTVAPQRIGEGNTFRYRVSGDFAADGTQSVTLNYAAQAWSFTSAEAATAPDQSVDASTLATASHSYIDIAFTPSVQINPAQAPYTIDTVPESTDITLSGAGINGPPIQPVDMGLLDATALGNGVYRYYIKAEKFQVAGDGQVTVSVAAGSVVDSSLAGNTNRATTQTFTIQGTTGRVTGPADGGLVGMASLNSRGFLDVTFGFPSGKTLDLDSIYDLAPEFTLNAATGHAIRLDGTQAPVLLPATGNANTFTFRYFTLGSYTSGEVTLTLLAGAIGFTDGSVNTSTDTLQVAAPATANIGYLDIRYQPVAGYVLDADSILDAGNEFSIAGDGRGTVTFATIALPVIRLTNSNTFRYFLQGDFAAGDVSIEFGRNTFQSAVADTANVLETGAVEGNLPTSVEAETAEGFTIVVLTATLADPVAGASVDADLLNNRGWFDVTFALNGNDSIDIASILDLDPEFTVTIASGAGTLVLDNTQAPVRVGETGTTYRYWYTGTFKTGTLDLTLIAGGFNYLNAANEPTPNPAGAMTPPLDLTQKPSSSWIDVRYTAVGGVTLDVATFADEAREFALTGSGVGGAALLPGAPMLLSSSSDDIDNDGDGIVDEADETVYRYFVSRGFQAGSVAVAFTGANWADTDGNRGVDVTEAFQVIETLKDNGQSGQSVGRVFYIEISGGIKLQGLGFTDEPIIDIRGKVTLEIGDFQLTNGNIIKRFTIDASGTIKIIKLGNIGSAAARFVLQAGATVSGNPEFWGVAKIQANLDFLKNYGIFVEGSALLQINTTNTPKTETIALEGIPGDVIRENIALSVNGLSGSVLGEVDMSAAFATALGAIDTDPTKAGDQFMNTTGAKIQTVIRGQQWKIITRNAADETKFGPSYFLTFDSQDGTLDLKAEGQTFELAGRVLLDRDRRLDEDQGRRLLRPERGRRGAPVRRLLPAHHAAALRDLRAGRGRDPGAGPQRPGGRPDHPGCDTTCRACRASR
jgi:hypothetical protein